MIGYQYISRITVNVMIQIHIMYNMLNKCFKKDRNAFKQKEIKMIFKKRGRILRLKKCIIMY